MLHWIGSFVVMPAMESTQTQYYYFHQAAFLEDGSLDEEGWSAFEGKDKLCQSVIGNPGFLCVLLFFWSARMLVEFKDARDIATEIHRLPDLAPGTPTTDMVIEREEEDNVGIGSRLHNHIVALNNPTRICLYLGVVAPRLCITGYLWFMGLEWLSATVKFQDLVLNSLALGFVVDVDELFYAAFFPDKFRKQVKMTTMDCPRIIMTQEDLDEQMLSRFHQNTFFVLICAGSVVTYYLCFQTVLPGFKFDIDKLCEQHLLNRGTLVCKAFQPDCFPYGNPGNSSG